MIKPAGALGRLVAAWMGAARLASPTSGQNLTQPMNEYIVSARKYRPMKFSDVVGQERADHHSPQYGQVGQTGPRLPLLRSARCGKDHLCAHLRQGHQLRAPHRQTARPVAPARVARLLRRAAPSTSSSSMPRPTMVSIRSSSSWSRPASLRRWASYKVFIIDEVHMLSAAGLQRLPQDVGGTTSAHVIFILATTEKHKILPTILCAAARSTTSSECPWPISSSN